MSLWSARSPDHRDRGLVQPVPALLAAVIVCAAVSLYATALHDRAPTRDRDLAAPAADEAVAALTETGVADPERLAAASQQVPAGREANLTLTGRDRTWSVGPAPPDDASTATRTVTVRVGPGQHRPARFRMVIWT